MVPGRQRVLRRAVLQLGGLTLQIPQLANASWTAVQNLSRSFVTSQHQAAAAGLTLNTRSFVSASDNVLQVELSLAGAAVHGVTFTLVFIYHSPKTAVRHSPNPPQPVVSEVTYPLSTMTLLTFADFFAHLLLIC